MSQIIGGERFRGLIGCFCFSLLALSVAAQMPPASGTMTAAPTAAPQALGPKAPGKIRIGVVPAQAQLGQGNNAQEDYGTPIRNAIVLLMSGPAVEIAPLDSRIPVQVQAEAQQKQCDYILYSAVTVAHASAGGFGKFMKMGPARCSARFPCRGMASRTRIRASLVSESGWPADRSFTAEGKLSRAVALRQTRSRCAARPGIFRPARNSRRG